MKHTSFWNTLAQPIIALAPMDGVTDAPFSSIVASRQELSRLLYLLG
ncbi:MAG: hypothetical protein JO215_13180 [Ktedonobacteraceae bacterium]|nr:hypothetical protein [Ktedonobacteraceae bacterium]MBV9614315.1 hypothetical protein [Ktedonobacteraceae bacterium]